MCQRVDTWQCTSCDCYINFLPHKPKKKKKPGHFTLLKCSTTLRCRSPGTHDVGEYETILTEPSFPTFCISSSPITSIPNPQLPTLVLPLLLSYPQLGIMTNRSFTWFDIMTNRKLSRKPLKIRRNFSLTRQCTRASWVPGEWRPRD